jgi:hypothetical protein
MRRREGALGKIHGEQKKKDWKQRGRTPVRRDYSNQRNNGKQAYCVINESEDNPGTVQPYVAEHPA